MKPIVLDEEFDVGIKIIDDQHRRIAEVINSPFENNNLELIEKLILRIEEHFRTEEELMISYKDPKYISHKLEHDRTLKKYRDLRLKIKSNEIKLTVDHILSMQNWLINHIKMKDLYLGEFLSAKGIK